MNNLFQAIEAKLLTSPEKWILFFTDYKINEFLYSLEYPSISKLYLSLDDCCSLFSLPNNCVCSDIKIDSNIEESSILELMRITTNSILSNDFKIQNDLCSIDENATNDAVLKIKSDVMDTIDGNFLLQKSRKNDQNIIQVQLNVSVYSNQDSDLINVINIGKIIDESFKLNPGMSLRMMRRFFRIGVTEFIPWAYQKRDPETNKFIYNKNGESIWEGYCIDFIQKLSEQMSFDYELIKPKNGTFGFKQPNGKWDGLIGDLVTGETDISVAALKMTAEREEVIDFIAPYFEQTGMLISRYQLSIIKI